MNTRGIQLLKKLIDGRYHTINSLAKELSVSERLIRYTIDDVEVFLKRNEIDEIVCDRNLGVKLNINVKNKEKLENTLYNLDSYQYTLDSEERKLYILLSLCTTNNNITSYQLAHELNVSKSSIDKDIINLRKELEKFELSIISQGSKGSYIRGDERDIRMYFYRNINRNIDFSHYITQNDKPFNFVEKNINERLFLNYLQHIKKAIEKSEQKINMNLTYQSYKDICIHLSIGLIRNQLGHKLDKHTSINKELLNTQGYILSNMIIDELRKTIDCSLDEVDIFYLSILINSARYTTMQGPVIADWANTQMLVTSLIKNVSRKIKIDLTDDEELSNALILHIGPTIFKLKNNIPVVNPNLIVVKREYQNVFKAVEQSIYDLESDELAGLGEDDVSYITLHFCASLERYKRFKKEYNILIVCVHSIATASLMKEIICTKFKNINVIKTTTRDNLNNINLDNIDFIVSSVDLDYSPVPYIKVNVVLKDSDEVAIQELMEKINSPKPQKDLSIIDEVMKIIDSNISQDTTKIKDDLTYYFEKIGLIKPLSSSSLYDYLKKDKINIINSVDDLEEAIKIVCTPMINNNNINNNYIKSILKTLDDVGNYMVIDRGVALVHGEMGDGVYEDSMSLLVVKDGVKFGHKKYDPVHLILCLATNKQHTMNMALSNFLKFLEEYEKDNTEKYFNKEYLIEKIRKASQYD